MKTTSKLLSVAIAGSSWFVAAPTVIAQTSFALEEIVVTAQRREQNLTDVPIAVQAFSEESLQNSGVNSVGQLGVVTPGLNMTSQLLSFTPSIRGVGSPDASVGQESTVAMYVDGVYLANSNASIFSFNSVERVEVLKGPQGTLFGRNATGGLVQVVTRDPGYEAYVKGAVSYGNYDTAGVKLYGTTGISDSVAADLSVFYKDQGEGYGDNLTLNQDTDLKEEFGIRSKWLIEASDKTQIRLTVDYAEMESDIGVQKSHFGDSVGIYGQLVFAGCVAQLGGNPAAPTPEQFGTCLPVGQDATATSATKAPADFHDTFTSVEPWITSETTGFAAKVDHSFDSVDLVSITSYRESEVTMDFEQGGAALPLINIHIDKQDYETYSQEFQLLKQGGDLEWILGLYFYHDESGFDQPLGIQISGIAVPAAQQIFAMIETDSTAAFGELTYNLTEATRLTAGARWTKDERSIDQQVLVGGAMIADIQQDEEWTEPTWRAILDHDLSENTMVYGSLSRGFKSGNYNVTGVGNPAVNPEFIDAYEIGLKSTLLDGRAQVNAAAYFYEYDDLQVSRIVGGSLVTVNAAAAEIQGLEMDFVANVTDNFQLRGGVSWMDTEYTEFEDAPVFAPNPLGLGGNIETIEDLSGEPLARAPELTFNVGGTYALPLEFGEILLGGNYYFNDGFGWEPSGRTQQDSYELVNAFISWHHPEDTWGIRLFGENLTDEEYVMFLTEQALGDNYAAAAPRTYGVEVSFEF